jgi:hypothetical protein
LRRGHARREQRARQANDDQNPHDEYVATVNADHKTATGNIPLRNRVQGF